MSVLNSLNSVYQTSLRISKNMYRDVDVHPEHLEIVFNALIGTKMSPIHDISGCTSWIICDLFNMLIITDYNGLEDLYLFHMTFNRVSWPPLANLLKQNKSIKNIILYHCTYPVAYSEIVSLLVSCKNLKEIVINGLSQHLDPAAFGYKCDLRKCWE